MDDKSIDTLTDKQREALEAIQKLIAGQGYPPTLAELTDVLDVTKASVQQRLNQLERKNFIDREPHIARGITVKVEGGDQ